MYTVSYGTDTLPFLGPNVWSIVPSKIREAKSPGEFKNKIKRRRAVTVVNHILRGLAL